MPEPSGPPRAPWFGRRRLRWRSLRLRDAVLLSLPLWLVAGWLVLGASADFQRMHAYGDWWARQTGLMELFRDRVRAAVRLPQALALRLRLDPTRDDPAILRLRLPRNEWAAWQRSPLALWGEWLDADRVEGSDLHPGKIRKRGDTSVHWTTPKKSFTLKTPRSRLYKEQRRLGFSVKTPLPQLVANALAGEFDVLAPETALVAVYANDRFYGVHRYTELVNEEFLRHRQRMPGNVWRADTAERGEVFRGVPRAVFRNPYVWDRVAKDGGPRGQRLERFLAAVNASDFDSQLALRRQVDAGEVARLLAYLLVMGDPYHLSNVHNQFWYQDPASDRMHPIPWDIRVLDLAAPAPHPVNEGLRALLRDPWIFRDVLAEVHAQLEAGRLLPEAEALLAEAEARFTDELAYDRLRGGAIPPLGSPDETLDILRRNLAELARRRDDAQVRFALGAASGRGRILDLQAGGWSASELVGLGTGAPGMELWADADRDGRFGPGDRRIAAHWQAGELRLETPEPLLVGVDGGSWAIAPAPMHYRFFVVGGGDVSLRVRNAITGAEVAPSAWTEGEPIPAGWTWHPWRDPRPEPRDRHLAGAVHLTETLRVPAGATLVIDPGTRLTLEPDVSILAHGRVLALGTADAPIRLEPSAPGRPWGALALQGPGSAGSRFRQVHFLGGGGAADLDGVEYKGMVSVHGTRGVRFEHCTFAANLRSDDALNAVHSEVDVLDSHFHDTNADAVDYDYGSGVIGGNLFERIGNDAIDLMTSAPRIVGNRMEGASDKAVSVGQASDPLIFGNDMRGCDIGVEVKDRSAPWLVANRIHDNRIGVAQAVKNWRYGTGGFATLIDNELANDTDYAADDRSGRIGAPSLPPEFIELRYGVGMDADGRPVVRGAPLPPAQSVRVRDDFGHGTRDWRRGDGVSRLRIRDGALVMSFPRAPGAVEREIDWPLTDPSQDYLVLVEVAGRALAEGAIAFVADDGSEVVHTFEPTADLAQWRVEAVPLAPGRYRRLRLAGVPADAAARLGLRQIELFVLPAGVLP